MPNNLRRPEGAYRTTEAPDGSHVQHVNIDSAPSYADARDLDGEKSDSADLTGGPVDAFEVEVSGDVKYTSAAGNARVIPTTAGHIYPVRMTRLWSTGTTATGVVGYQTAQTAGLTVPPEVPQNLQLVVGSTQIAASWNAVTGATSYRLERSTNLTTWTAVYTSTGTSYTNTGLSNGTKYYYRVRAFNAAGGSSWSETLFGTPNAVVVQPQTPTSFTATPGDGQVVLDWADMSGATSYLLERSFDGSSGWATIYSNSTSTYTHTGLVNGITVYYRVSASNSGGASGYATASAAPQAASESAPYDALAADVLAAYGGRQLLSTYSGALASSSAWYDQSGNSYDATQGTATNAPLDLTGTDGKVCFDYWRSGANKSARYYNLPSGLSVNLHGCTIVLVTEHLRVDGQQTLLRLGSTGQYSLILNGSGLYAHLRTSNTATTIRPPSSRHALIITMDASNIITYFNTRSNASSVAAHSTGGTVTGGTIGAASLQWMGGDYELLIFNKKLSNDEIDAVFTEVGTAYSISTTPTARLVTEGESTGVGEGTEQNKTWQTLMGLPADVWIYNQCVPGQTLNPNITSDYTEYSSILSGATIPTYYILWGGGNDLVGGQAGSEVATEAFAHMANIIAASPTKTAIIPSTIAEQFANRDAYAEALEDGYVANGIDYFIPAHSNAAVGVVTGANTHQTPANYADSRHLNLAGNEAMAALVLDHFPELALLAA